MGDNTFWRERWCSIILIDKVAERFVVLLLVGFGVMFLIGVVVAIIKAVR